MIAGAAHQSGAAFVVWVGLSPLHTFSKAGADEITLIAGHGVEGDAHAGATVRHRSRVARDPSAPNLRQVHLIAGEVLHDLGRQGFDLQPGAIGENITTQGIDLLALPQGARLRLGAGAILRVEGLRNPCVQLDGHSPGLRRALLDRAPGGALIR